MGRTWNALLEEPVEVQGRGSGVGLLRSRRRSRRLLCFFNRIFKRSARVGPAGRDHGKVKIKRITMLKNR